MVAERANMERLTYTVREAAILIGVNPVAVYELTRQPGFPAVRIGRRIVIPRVGLKRWLDNQSGSVLEGQE